MTDQSNAPSSQTTASPKSKIGKIVVDKDICIGAAPCEVLAPGTFRVENGKAIVIDPHGNTDEEILDAAMSCPVLAIFIYDTEGNQLYPKKK